MAEYKDFDLHKLEKGFYQNLLNNNLVYFTGEYTKNGEPLCEFGPKFTDIDILTNVDSPQNEVGRTLRKIDKEYIEKKINNLKENFCWLEKNLKKIK